MGGAAEPGLEATMPERAGLLWSETKGTLWFDGPQHLKTALATEVEQALSGSVTVHEATAAGTIVVVDGRDHDWRDHSGWCIERGGQRPAGAGADVIFCHQCRLRQRPP